MLSLQNSKYNQMQRVKIFLLICVTLNHIEDEKHFLFTCRTLKEERCNLDRVSKSGFLSSMKYTWAIVLGHRLLGSIAGWRTGRAVVCQYYHFINAFLLHCVYFLYNDGHVLQCISNYNCFMNLLPSKAHNRWKTFLFV